MVWKTSGSWRPVINFSCLNLLVIQTLFKMETNQSILRAIQRGDWIVSIDLKDAYLWIPVHPDSRQSLRFVAFGIPYQFKALFYFLHGSAGLHPGHGSGFRYASSYRDSDAPLPRLLVGPGIISDQCSVGEEQGTFSLLRPWDLGQPGQVSSCYSSVCDVLRNVDCVYDFEGFPLSEEGFRPADTDRRVSILQAAKLRLLA